MSAKECQKIKKKKKRLKITKCAHMATDSAEAARDNEVDSLDEGFHEFVNSVLKFPAASASKRLRMNMRSMSRG